MTASSTTRPAPATGSLGSAARDGLVIMWRNLKRIPRIPELAIFAILQSIMFVLLFAFVFGGAIPLPGGGNYNEFLMPGIFAQNIVFACGITAIGMTDDVQKGIIDRFLEASMYFVMALVLLLRPRGLLGRTHREFVAAMSENHVSLVVAAWALIILPFALDFAGLPLRSSIDVVVFAIACMGLNILVGHTGLVSFGHGAWFGLAAYAVALS